MRKRELEIGDEDSPDIYAITFYHFRFRNQGSETNALVYKTHLTFMMQFFLFLYLLKAMGAFKGQAEFFGDLKIQTP